MALRTEGVSEEKTVMPSQARKPSEKAKEANGGATKRKRNSNTDELLSDDSVSRKPAQSKSSSRHRKKKKSKRVSSPASDDSANSSQRSSMAAETIVIDDDDNEREEDLEIDEKDIVGGKGGGSRERAAVKLFFNKTEDGSRACRVCEKIHAKERNYHVTTYGPRTGNSTLKRHIKSNHPKAFEMLEKLDESPNQFPISLNMNSLETWFPKKAPSKPFASGDFALLVLKFFVACDLPLATVNAPEFRELITYLRPYLKPVDFPDRHNLAELLRGASSEE